MKLTSRDDEPADAMTDIGRTEPAGRIGTRHTTDQERV
jgi:hypothetical protein